MPTATQKQKAGNGTALKASNGKPVLKHFCSNPKATPPVLPAGISNERASLIVKNVTKWANGTTLHYYFFDKETDGAELEYTDGTRQWKPWRGTPAQMNVVRKAFKMWKDLGLGLEFIEVKDREESQIRIGFMEDDGAWSYIGKDALKQSKNDRTMNFGWDIAVADRHNGIDTVLHEIGHALGFPHEHQNPFAGIVWNEEAVYAALAAPPNNWNREKTYHNIIRKLSTVEVNGSRWDPDSIMHYPFEPGMIKMPEDYAETGLNPAGGISEQDKKYALLFYPAANRKKDIDITAMDSYEIDVKNCEQQNYIFEPDVTRYYTLQTFGQLDTVMVLNEQLSNGKHHYLSGDDNSGTDNNAQIRAKLFRGKTYIIKLRVYYKNPKEKAVLMVS